MSAVVCGKSAENQLFSRSLFIISMRPRKFTTDGRMEKRTTASFLPAALPTGLGMIGVVVVVVLVL